MPQPIAVTRWSWVLPWSPWWRSAQLPLMIDRCLWVLLVLAPLAWGGRGGFAGGVFGFIVCVTTVLWLVQLWTEREKQWRWTPTMWIPLLAMAWVALQMVPLPGWIVNVAAPRAAELLPLWHGDSILATYGLNEWRTISFNPSEGQISLGILIGYTLVFFLFLQKLRSIHDLKRILGWMGIAAIVMAAFGLLQYPTADGLFFWVYEHPFRRTNDYVCGSFINHNHFASFLAMGAAAIVYQIVGESPAEPSRGRPGGEAATRYKSIAWSVGLAIVVLALVMSASRGGILAATCGVFVMTAVYWRRKLVGTRQLAYLLISATLLATGISVYNEDRFTERLEGLASGSLDTVDRLGARRAIWAANLRAIAAGWLTGSGAGTHQDIYPVYIDRSFPKVFTHAENGYLQIATELGVPGMLLLTASIACAARWTHMAWKRSTTRDSAACLGAVLAGVVVSLVHSMVDFVWYVPATMTCVLVLLVALRRLARGNDESQLSSSAMMRSRIELTAAVTCALLYMAVVLSGPAMASAAWDTYLTTSAAQGVDQTRAIAAFAESGDPNDLATQRARLEAKVVALRSALGSSCHSSAIHLRLARTYLQLFDARRDQRENGMNVGQLQGVIATNRFETAEDVQEWLERAVSNDIVLLRAARSHAIRCIGQAPLKGQGYVCLANLWFLDHPNPHACARLLSQAELLCPRDGNVLFEIGKQHLILGNLQQAIDVWVRCYEQQGQHRLLVVATLAGRIPAVDFLTTFAPDWHTLRAVWQRYVAAGDSTDVAAVLAYATRLMENVPPTDHDYPTAYIWLWLGQMYDDAGNDDQHFRCLERAMNEDDMLLPVRKNYAFALYRATRYAEAEPHLRWCLARDSSDRNVRRLIKQSAIERHKQTAKKLSRPSLPLR